MPLPDKIRGFSIDQMIVDELHKYDWDAASESVGALDDAFGDAAVNMATLKRVVEDTAFSFSAKMHSGGPVTGSLDTLAGVAPAGSAVATSMPGTHSLTAAMYDPRLSFSGGGLTGSLHSLPKTFTIPATTPVPVYMSHEVGNDAEIFGYIHIDRSLSMHPSSVKSSFRTVAVPLQSGPVIMLEFARRQVVINYDEEILKTTRNVRDLHDYLLRKHVKDFELLDHLITQNGNTVDMSSHQLPVTGQIRLVINFTAAKIDDPVTLYRLFCEDRFDPASH